MTVKICLILKLRQSQLNRQIVYLVNKPSKKKNVYDGKCQLCAKKKKKKKKRKNVYGRLKKQSKSEMERDGNRRKWGGTEWNWMGWDEQKRERLFG